MKIIPLPTLKNSLFFRITPPHNVKMCAYIQTLLQQFISSVNVCCWPLAHHVSCYYITIIINIWPAFGPSTRTHKFDWVMENNFMMKLFIILYVHRVLWPKQLILNRRRPIQYINCDDKVVLMRNILIYLQSCCGDCLWVYQTHVWRHGVNLSLIG